MILAKETAHHDLLWKTVIIITLRALQRVVVNQTSLFYIMILMKETTKPCTSDDPTQLGCIRQPSFCQSTESPREFMKKIMDRSQF